MPRAAAVVLHPHPAMGGDSSHPLVVAVTTGLDAQGIAARRPDLPDPDPERAAVALAGVADDLLQGSGAEHLVLVGYSWGSVVTARTEHPALVGRVLVAPPVAMLELEFAAEPHAERPTLVLVPAHDQFGGPDAVCEQLADRPHTTIEVVQGADHFLAGAIDRIAARAVAWSAERVHALG